MLGPRVLGHGTDVIFRGVTAAAASTSAELHHILFQAVALYASSSCCRSLPAFLIAGVVQD